MLDSRVNVLSIAGFDPSAGAGILADIKTFENHGVYGFGICSSNTWQNQSEFHAVQWFSYNDIISQLEILLKKNTIQAIKIGLIENLEVLKDLVYYLNKNMNNIQIIWDPIIKASAGYLFHEDFSLLNSILPNINLITPNIPEANILFSNSNDLQSIIKKNNYCNILLKGGHSDKTTDLLITHNHIYQFKGEKFEGFSKHGSGCVLSSSIVANLALGCTIDEACKNAKEYIHHFLKSNKTLLGYHHKNS